MKTLREEVLGKAKLRLVSDKGGFAGVLIVDGEVRRPIRGESADEVWRALTIAARKASPHYFGLEGARARFLEAFPGGFASAKFLDEERGYKVKAKVELDRALPLECALNGEGLGQAALAAFRATNLLSPFEKTRLAEVLRGPNADLFVRGAAVFAVGDLERGLKDMKSSLQTADVAKWTAITYLPFLWRPDEHMFLKPRVTCDFAERVGHEFASVYDAALKLDVYKSLVDLAHLISREFTDLAPKDFIDVQSLIWVVGEYDLSEEEDS